MVLYKKKAKTITDADFADDIELLVNTPTQAESLLHSLEQAAGDMSMQSKRGDVSVLNGDFLKLADKFTNCPIYSKCHQYVTSEGMDCY